MTSRWPEWAIRDLLRIPAHSTFIDELGYLAYDNRVADLLFQVINRRYERGPLLVTNLAFKDWGTVFPNAACVTALLDRLTHHAEILTLTGESYRRQEAKATQKARRGKG